MSIKREKVWSEEELIIAYYIAKWNLSGIQISEEDLAAYVIDTTANSLKMQTANFRHLLQIDGYQLAAGPSLGCNKRVIIDKLKDKTITQVRKIILDYIDSIDKDILKRKSTSVNLSINKNKEKLNKTSQLIFEQKLKSLNKYRNLRKIN